jgi:methionyl-tRNA formyltransferase
MGVPRQAARRLRVAAFGSPAFAIPSLERLCAEHELVLVVTQPDKPAGRGLAPRTPPAAAFAGERGLPLEQPSRLKRDEAFAERLRRLDLDVAVTAAYGKLLPEALLRIPRHGFLNVHASLLPKYRGAAPVQWALIEGERETGISIMQTEAGLDTGPVRHVLRTAILEHENSEQLMARLAELGAEALSQALALLAHGALPSHPQDDDRATHAPRLTREDGRIRWEASAEALLARHRGVTPWPGSWFSRQGPKGAETVKVHALSIAEPAAGGRPAAEGRPAAAPPGTVTAVDERGVHVAAGAGSVVLEVLQSPDRPRQDAAAWARGARLSVGERCG